MSIRYRSFTKLEPGELLDGLVSLHTKVLAVQMIWLEEWLKNRNYI
ncbi:hypothetical protein [Planomicrobium okeanokoites]|nr:hypothetical protein [Planomicrobium okeanokoites]